jgi:hypothetical protein
MPWEGDSAGEGKYKYHPGGDMDNAPKDAPSAINVVVVPDVTLPKVWTVLYHRAGAPSCRQKCGSWRESLRAFIFGCRSLTM